MNWVIIFTVIFYCVSIGSGQIQSLLVDNNGKGSIDWSNRNIYAAGVGIPNPDLPKEAQRRSAEREAQQIVLKNALETVKSINLNCSTTVNDLISQNDNISRNIDSCIKEFQNNGHTKYTDGGAVEISVKIPLDGSGRISDLLIGKSISENPSVNAFDGKKSDKAVIFTGLIIDCKNLDVKPALNPRILDESGNEVYGSKYISRKWAIKDGVVGYTNEIEKALKQVSRIGNNPGMIKAQKVQGVNSADIIISKNDAADIRSTSANLKILSECRIILVVN